MAWDATVLHALRIGDRVHPSLGMAVVATVVGGRWRRQIARVRDSGVGVFLGRRGDRASDRGHTGATKWSRVPASGSTTYRSQGRRPRHRFTPERLRQDSRTRRRDARPVRRPQYLMLLSAQPAGAFGSSLRSLEGPLALLRPARTSARARRRRHQVPVVALAARRQGHRRLAGRYLPCGHDRTLSYCEPATPDVRTARTIGSASYTRDERSVATRCAQLRS